MHLRSKFAPQLNGELAICGAKGANDSIFEGLDSSFFGINPVVVGLNQLEHDLLWGEVSFYDFFVAWLFIMFTSGLNRLLTRDSKFDFYASKMRSESRPAMGVIRIAFVS